MSGVKEIFDGCSGPGAYVGSPCDVHVRREWTRVAPLQRDRSGAGLSNRRFNLPIHRDYEYAHWSMTSFYQSVNERGEAAYLIPHRELPRGSPVHLQARSMGSRRRIIRDAADILEQE